MSELEHRVTRLEGAVNELRDYLDTLRDWLNEMRNTLVIDKTDPTNTVHYYNPPKGQ